MRAEQCSSLIQFEILNFAMLIFLFVGYMESRDPQVSRHDDFLRLAEAQPAYASEKAQCSKPDRNLSITVFQ